MLQPRGYLQRISSPIWLEVHPQIPTRQPVLFLCRQEPVKLASEARQRTWRFLPSCRNTSEGKCDVAIKSPQGETHNYSLSNSPELASWVQFPSASSFFRALSSTSVASAPLQTGIAASISQPSLSSSSARFRASSEATSMRRNLSPWLQYSLVNPITAGAPGCRHRHVDPPALIKQGRRSCKQLLILSRCRELPWVAQTLKSMQLFRSDDNRTHQPPLRNGSAQGLRESPL